ncbi:RNA polymerase sigma factor [Nonomuraea sp. SBT364]|uniref:RNA polymerase sigma factor n=1 Tax=Nonomuraea sp. SBT364 TaxID=1580530 RepID=UPI00069DBE64|nr:sigma factor [Nonomuraea sp. SBT364]
MSGDAALAARLVAGDAGALADAYDAHSPYVYGVAVKVTGSPEHAAEVTREVFAALWERPLSYDPRLGSLRGWLVSRALHESAPRSGVS